MGKAGSPLDCSLGWSGFRWETVWGSTASGGVRGGPNNSSCTVLNKPVNDPNVASTAAGS